MRGEQKQEQKQEQEQKQKPQQKSASATSTTREPSPVQPSEVLDSRQALQRLCFALGLWGAWVERGIWVKGELPPLFILGDKLDSVRRAAEEQRAWSIVVVVNPQGEVVEGESR